MNSLGLRVNPRVVSMEKANDGGWKRGRGSFRITCMLGRGRGRVPAHDLRSSSRARLSISNCLSCSRTEASREAVLAHCSIHTLRAEHRTGQDRTGSTPESRRDSTNTGISSKNRYKGRGALAPCTLRNARSEVLMNMIFRG